MSLQVGAACYATLNEAGGAACSEFQPQTTTLFNGNISTTQCTAWNAKTGAITLQTVYGAPGGTQTTRTTVRTLVYQPCEYQQYVDAGIQIFVALLVLWGALLGYRKIIDFLNWSRGDAS